MTFVDHFRLSVCFRPVGPLAPHRRRITLLALWCTDRERLYDSLLFAIETSVQMMLYETLFGAGCASSFNHCPTSHFRTQLAEHRPGITLYASTLAYNRCITSHYSSGQDEQARLITTLRVISAKYHKISTCRVQNPNISPSSAADRTRIYAQQNKS